MSKKVNFAKLYAAAQIPPNGGLPAQNQTNAIVITPPPAAKSLQEALDRGLSTFEHTTQHGRTYTIDVERALRCRRQLQVQNSKHTPRALEEPRLDPIARRRLEQERERRLDRLREEGLKRLDPKVREEYLRSIHISLNRHHAQWMREREQEKAQLEEDLRAGRNTGCYTDSYWRAHDLEPPKKEKEHEEEEDIDLGWEYSDEEK